MIRLRSFARLLAITAFACCGPVALAAEAQPSWVGSWGSAQYIAAGDDAMPKDVVGEVTLRQLVRLSIGGSQLRIRVSNAFGTEPLQVRSVHIARSLGTGSSRIDASSDRVATFSARHDVIIPAGAELTSDPINIAVEPLSILAITLELASIPEQQT